MTSGPEGVRHDPPADRPVLSYRGQVEPLLPPRTSWTAVLALTIAIAGYPFIYYRGPNILAELVYKIG